MIATHNGEDHGSASSTPSAMPDMAQMDPAVTPSAMPSMSAMDDSAHSMDMGATGDHMSMDSMMSMGGPDLFPAWVMYLWIAALTAVLVFHCLHWIKMAGQHRWFHAAHIVMLVGMIYMFAMMEFKLDWVSKWLLVWLYALTTVAILGWMAVRIVQKKPFSYLWILALVQQAAMIYMWMPMSDWVAWLSYGLTAYFALEALGWLVGYIGDTKPGRGFAVGPGSRSDVVALGHTRFIDNVSMAVMAASMSYMFVGMQLMV